VCDVGEPGLRAFLLVEALGELAVRDPEEPLECGIFRRKLRACALANWNRACAQDWRSNSNDRESKATLVENNRLE
jgi:hypothetical protein